MMLLIVVFLLLACRDLNAGSSWRVLRNFRGGIVPEISKDGKYYEKFDLDYGCDDKVRPAGQMTGVLEFGKLSKLGETDPFLHWLNWKLERGPLPLKPDDRLKPYFAADFGKKTDLKRGENPKIIIVNRKLAAGPDGMIIDAPPVHSDDIEVREVWQPWIRAKCDFAVRYIVPNRCNIIDLMEAQKRFHSEVHFEQTSEGRHTATAHFVFKPTLWERLRGKKDIVLKRELDAEFLFDEDSAAQVQHRKDVAKARAGRERMLRKQQQHDRH